MRLHVEQAEFEHRKQSARTRANNQHIGFDRFAHRQVSLSVESAGRIRGGPGVWLRLSSQNGLARKAINMQFAPACRLLPARRKHAVTACNFEGSRRER